MLAVDRTDYPATFWTFDNWGANPASTIGTSVTPGTSNALGSWTQVATGANIAEDVAGFYFQVHTGSASAAWRDHLLDIGVDPAGGTSYTAIVSNFQVGCAPALTAAGAREHYLPLGIKAGSSVAVRVRGSNSTAGTVRFAARFYGRKSGLLLPVGSYSQTFGADTATSKGTAFTPGNAADGSWVDLGAITNPLWWWQVGYAIQNGTVSTNTITAEYTYIEVAVGDASNKQAVFKVMHGGTTAETCGLAAQTQLLGIAAYCPAAAGQNVYVRGRCNNAPDAGYHATVLGIGG